MNRIIIIGNGFDRAHKMPISDAEFVYWYFKKIFNNLMTQTEYRDEICKIQITEDFKTRITEHNNTSGNNCFEYFYDNMSSFQTEIKDLFLNIIKAVNTRKAVDMEDEYYYLLKNAVKKGDIQKSKELNIQLKDLLSKYIEYLKEIQTDFLSNCDVNREISSIFSSEINIKDVSVEWDGRLINKFEHWSNSEKNIWVPERTLVLNFNYTQFAEMKYLNGDPRFENVYIHGNISKPNNILFGYGDELDDDFHELLETNNNELLMNNKSIRVLENDNYRKLLRFIYSDPYQILILGLSCGKSDRTLLNTIFEHNNCFSIKPYYHRKSDGSDNYLEIIQNITRCFTDAKMVRDRVVSKERCSPLPQK